MHTLEDESEFVIPISSEKSPGTNPDSKNPMRARQVTRPPRFCVKPCPMVQMPSYIHKLVVWLRSVARLECSPQENMSPLNHHWGLILFSMMLAGTSKRT